MAKKFISNKDETVRMFENGFLESLSKVHFTVPLIIFVPIILYMLYIAIFEFSISTLSIIGLIIFGLFIWTITEYLLHRFIFHWELKSKLGARIHFIFHGVHHDYPSDSKRLVMPPSVSLPLAALFYFLFRFLIGDVFIYPFFAGFLIGYLFYDMTHYAVHHFNMHSKFWLAIKNHHIKHHYQDPDKGYGVSSPLWDFIFRTNYLKKEEENI
ncbi:MAG: sterol desaturase family protein [Ignavibacteriaceae bacterium]|nr:sterol desaturase family protein [Ignavibacterium sp.]MCC6255675.1 sterol desaturase family protein [Ignavibacteriaceae bacterium]HMN23801.1 sterol desaturase family protein [Ignavibacteriaceae bacterium]HRN25326.1 sterol desaturase family protein [Ignavibacteriaceae bacterium]HRP91635.1 sterol desaturase family protein [Ignavibacteriaceae bacterium]